MMLDPYSSPSGYACSIAQTSSLQYHETTRATDYTSAHLRSEQKSRMPGNKVKEQRNFLMYSKTARI